MSINAINWAMGQQLPPSHKLVLVSLADNANESGECWPGLVYIAERCGISRRTARRIACALEKQQLRTYPRFRKDGSCGSNLYVLSLPGEDNMSRTPAAVDSSTGKSWAVDNDIDDIPRTTNNSKIKSPLKATANPSNNFILRTSDFDTQRKRFFADGSVRESCCRALQPRFPALPFTIKYAP